MSSKSPDNLLKAIQTLLNKKHISFIPFNEESDFAIKCQIIDRGQRNKTKPKIETEFIVEIAKVHSFDSLYAIYFERIKGNAWNFKLLTENLLKECTL